jgi:hypothetical protein
MRTMVSDHITRYQTTGHYFYLADSGNAVNFLWPKCGPFIFLAQAEILAAIRDPDPRRPRSRYAWGQHDRPCRHCGDLALLLA